MKVISDNRKQVHNYKIIEKHECGIELLGWEVKSARAGTVQLNNSYCFFKKGELLLENATFKKYMLLKVDEQRQRKLLMHKNELLRLYNKKEKYNGSTIIPTKIYFNNQSRIKVEIALAQGLNKIDKRELIKERDNERYLKKTLKIWS